MKNQVERIYEEFINEPFTLDKLFKTIHKNWEHPLIKELSGNADYGWFQRNYLADLLKNQVKKNKTPKFSRRKNDDGVFEYTYIKGKNINSKKIEDFKRESIEYLSEQGYDMGWESMIKALWNFKDNPIGKLENEIDSVLFVEDGEIEDYIMAELKKLD